MANGKEHSCRFLLRFVIVPIIVALIGGCALVAASLVDRYFLRGPAPTMTHPVMPTTRPSRIPPEQALAEYYRLVSAGNYDVTWSMLTDHFKTDRDLSFDDYVDFWDTVGQVELSRIQTGEVTDTSAWLTADLTYSLLSGTTVHERMRFNLVWDSAGQQWMITHTERLQS
jgi:hypothetical protein